MPMAASRRIASETSRRSITTTSRVHPPTQVAEAMADVVIIDTGLCNLRSIIRAVEECDAPARIATSAAEVGAPSHVILPGVGAFPDAMENLARAGLVDELNEQVGVLGVPFLGICLGMQLLATRGTEGRDTQGLGWIDGTVVRLVASPDERVPHVGWN